MLLLLRAPKVQRFLQMTIGVGVKKLSYKDKCEILR